VIGKFIREIRYASSNLSPKKYNPYARSLDYNGFPNIRINKLPSYSRMFRILLVISNYLRRAELLHHEIIEY